MGLFLALSALCSALRSLCLCDNFARFFFWYSLSYSLRFLRSSSVSCFLGCVSCSGLLFNSFCILLVVFLTLFVYLIFILSVVPPPIGSVFFPPPLVIPALALRLFLGNLGDIPFRLPVPTLAPLQYPLPMQLIVPLIVFLLRHTNNKIVKITTRCKTTDSHTIGIFNSSTSSAHISV